SVEIGVNVRLQQDGLHLLPNPIMYTGSKPVEGWGSTTRIGSYGDDLCISVHARNPPAPPSKDDALIDGQWPGDWQCSKWFAIAYQAELFIADECTVEVVVVDHAFPHHAVQQEPRCFLDYQTAVTESTKQTKEAALLHSSERATS